MEKGLAEEMGIAKTPLLFSSFVKLNVNNTYSSFESVNNDWSNIKSSHPCYLYMHRNVSNIGTIIETLIVFKCAI